jgi:putative oxygen-independent coproporphyrinogen III oxidase
MKPSLALYIHWPFCASKCPYCDFNSHVRERVDQQAWRQALLAELDYEYQLTREHQLMSIFFGGGTPSLMDPQTTAALIEKAKSLWGHDNLEITLEANPNSVEADRFAAFAAAGVNRVSIGIQSFDEAELKFLGRLHSAGEAQKAIDIAQKNFARVSFDLIYALPSHTPEMWRKKLAEALYIGTGHLSLYQLTIEANTGFAGKYARGEFQLPDEDTAAALFDLTQEMTAHAGLPMYEVSNHARAGEESRHNLMYWTYGNYVGIGPGAHGRRNNVATQRLKKPETWLAAVNTHAHGLESETVLDSQACAEEALLMGLRLKSGINRVQFLENTGLTLENILDPEKTDQLQASGHLHCTPAGIFLSPAGMLLVNHILGKIVRQ